MNADNSAFPLSWVDARGNYQLETGLTKREYFAAMAMQGLMAASAHENARGIRPEAMAMGAVRMADLIIAELAK